MDLFVVFVYVSAFEWELVVYRLRTCIIWIICGDLRRWSNGSTWQSSRHVTDGRQARASAGGEGGGGVDGGGRHGTQVGRVRLFIRPGRRGLGLTRVWWGEGKRGKERKKEINRHKRQRIVTSGPSSGWYVLFTLANWQKLPNCWILVKVRGKYQLDALCNILHNDTSNVYLPREDLPVCLIEHCARSWGQRALLAHNQDVNTLVDNQENNRHTHFIVYVCVATVLESMRVARYCILWELFWCVMMKLAY